MMLAKVLENKDNSDNTRIIEGRMNMLIRKRTKAQSILEYTIILSAIIAGIILAATKMVKPAVRGGMEDAANLINSSTSKIGDLAGEINMTTP